MSDYTCEHCAKHTTDDDDIDRNGYCMGCQDENLSEICGDCRGSGMGYAGDSRCRRCGGDGEIQIRIGDL